MKCTPLKDSDLAQVIEDFVPQFPWRSQQDVVNELQSSLNAEAKHKILTVREHNRVVAIGAYGVNPISANCWHLYLSATLPFARRKGYNGLLVRERIEWISKLRELPATNILVATKRPEFFADYGFKVVTPNGSSTLMVKHLP